MTSLSARASGPAGWDNRVAVAWAPSQPAPRWTERALRSATLKVANWSSRYQTRGRPSRLWSQPMSAAAHQPEPIRTPDRLDLPDSVRDLADRLPPGAQAHLARELLVALQDARVSADLAPVQAVVQNWDRVATELAGSKARLEPEAQRLVAALKAGASPMSLGLVEGGLEQVLAERGISVR